MRHKLPSGGWIVTIPVSLIALAYLALFFLPRMRDIREMRHELPHLAILKIFAIRAAVELERRILERERLSFTNAHPAQCTPTILH